MLFDIGAGIIFSILVSEFYGLELTAAFIIGGIAFSLLPDIDAIVELWKYKNLGGFEIRIHREWVHYPLLYMPAVPVIYYFFGADWATLFLLGVLLHFIHDSIGLGWGIKWFGPFSRNNYKLFSEKDGTLSRRLLVKWTSEEFVETLKKYHNPNWFRDYYLRPSFINIFEFLVFLIAIATLYIYLK